MLFCSGAVFGAIYGIRPMNRLEAKKMALEKKALGGKPRSTVPQKDLGSPMNMFKGYNLEELDIPVECRPGEQGMYQGRHGYTVGSTNGSVP